MLLLNFVSIVLMSGCCFVVDRFVMVGVGVMVGGSVGVMGIVDVGWVFGCSNVVMVLIWFCVLLINSSVVFNFVNGVWVVWVDVGLLKFSSCVLCDVVSYVVIVVGLLVWIWNGCVLLLVGLLLNVCYWVVIVLNG